MTVIFDGPVLLNATAETLRLASRLMLGAPVIENGEAHWNAIVDRIDAAAESCRRRLPIGGADYIDEFAAELRELVELVPPATRRMLYASLAMLPAIRQSMCETVDVDAIPPTERAPR